MHDIKIPDSSSKKPANFEVSHVHVGDVKAAEASDRVKVRFDKFVQLVATHDFEGVMQKHGEEDIILSTNLLTDLANAHEEEESGGKKVPIFLIVGILIGVVITYLLVRF